MAPIHDAAARGDLAEVNRLLAEDPTRLNELNGGNGLTPLMCAVREGSNVAATRLLALGADVRLHAHDGWTAVHFACYRDHPSTLALLLDAGAPLTFPIQAYWTPLQLAAFKGANGCIALLLARGGPALELDAVDADGRTALHWAAWHGHHIAIRLLLDAGADPTIRDNVGKTPLDTARQEGKTQCIPLLQTALAEPQRPRLLFKARALVEAAQQHRRILAGNVDGRDEGACVATFGRALAAAPPFLKGRASRCDPLPAVEIEINDRRQQSEELGACLRFVLGQQGHGGWAGAEDERATMRTERLFPELFIELLELLVPRWDGARKGQPLGAYWETEDEEEDEDEDIYEAVF